MLYWYEMWECAQGPLADWEIRVHEEWKSVKSNQIYKLVKTNQRHNKHVFCSDESKLKTHFLNENNSIIRQKMHQPCK